jgi:hypothetical protein
MLSKESIIAGISTFIFAFLFYVSATHFGLEVPNFWIRVLMNMGFYYVAFYTLKQLFKKEGAH